MIVEADIDTQRNYRDVHVPWIAVIITVGDAERELSFPQSVAIINRKQPGRSAGRSSRAHGRRLVPRIVFRSQRLGRDSGDHYQCTERSY